jgi:hypothetical protein
MARNRVHVILSPSEGSAFLPNRALVFRKLQTKSRFFVAPLLRMTIATQSRRGGGLKEEIERLEQLERFEPNSPETSLPLHRRVIRIKLTVWS